jgi:hypothetical protein
MSKAAGKTYFPYLRSADINPKDNFVCEICNGKVDFMKGY